MNLPVKENNFNALGIYLAFSKKDVWNYCWWMLWCCHHCDRCQILGWSDMGYFLHHLPTWSSYSPDPEVFHTYRRDDLKYSQEEVFRTFCMYAFTLIQTARCLNRPSTVRRNINTDQNILLIIRYLQLSLQIIYNTQFKLTD
jgi:hypothetical protein